MAAASPTDTDLEPGPLIDLHYYQARPVPNEFTPAGKGPMIRPSHNLIASNWLGLL
jgi:hypothetical protein